MPSPTILALRQPPLTFCFPVYEESITSLSHSTAYNLDVSAQENNNQNNTFSLLPVA